MIAKMIAIGSLLMAVVIGAGAFGAHALKDRLDEYARGVYDKAVFYHFVHALAILIVGLIAQNKIITEELAQKVFFLFLGGIAIFSGSLYLLALSGVRWLGAITPIGGSLFIIAWTYLAVSILRNS